MTSKRCCPALVISATASGQGKTSVTAALAAYHRQRGLNVRIFKTGPDFLDPMILERASGNPVYQIDLWMVGEQGSRELLFDAAHEADLILIEGVMGLFDGDPSTADLAICFGIPVLAVIDASAMAQTFGALASGLANYRSELTLAGVFANKVGSERHLAMLKDSLPDNITCYGALPRQTDFTLPSRHLGLVQAQEVADLDQRITTLAEKIYPENLLSLPAKIMFSTSDSTPPAKRLDGVKIAIAKDPAFSFIYQANLDLLNMMGAELIFFSPLNDKVLPDADSLYFPGGYPELYLLKLSENKAMKKEIFDHYDQDKPILAECGGMLYLSELLTNAEGEQSPMVGVIKGHAEMQKRLTALALQEVDFSSRKIRGHTYHHSLFKTDLEPVYKGKSPNESITEEGVFQQKRLTASYIHFYFPSAPDLVASFFQA